MKKLKFLFPVVFLAAMSHAQTVSDKDLDKAAGDWKGKLTYLDYTSGKVESIDASLSVTRLKENQFEFAVRYPGESSHNGKDLYRITDDGRAINGVKLLERPAGVNGILKIVFEESGTDGNDRKPATFHHVLEIGDRSLSLTKMVRYEGEQIFFERNRFSMSR